MDSILELFKQTNNINQAYLLEGDVRAKIQEINSIIEKILGASIIGNSDYYLCETEVFDIDESRRLRQTSQKKSVSGGKRFFVIGADSFLEKAQNALLKTLEEPIEGTHFFIVVPDKRQLLPTVISRLIKIDNIGNSRVEIKNDNTELCHRFLSSNTADRILMISEIIKEKEEPRIQRSAVRKFILCLEGIVFKRYRKGELDSVPDIFNLIKGISKSADYSGDIASAPKLLLEYLSFICPRVDETKKK